VDSEKRPTVSSSPPINQVRASGVPEQGLHIFHLISSHETGVGNVQRLPSAYHEGNGPIKIAPATPNYLSNFISKFNARFDGGRTRARTLDPLIKSQLLYQLSYAPIEIRALEPGSARHYQRRRRLASGKPVHHAPAASLPFSAKRGRCRRRRRMGCGKRGAWTAGSRKRSCKPSVVVVAGHTPSGAARHLPQRSWGRIQARPPSSSPCRRACSGRSRASWRGAWRRPPRLDGRWRGRASP
jgi:hypothetical protein